jgi:hypothetical protein
MGSGVLGGSGPHEIFKLEPTRIFGLRNPVEEGNGMKNARSWPVIRGVTRDFDMTILILKFKPRGDLI